MVLKRLFKRLSLFALMFSSFTLWPTGLIGQDVAGVSEQRLKEVLPRADRFVLVDGDIPVAEGYRFGGETGERLVGYVFVTSDVPPEPFGYSGPVQALVGMDLEGSLTGVRVMDYWESIQESMGDFLRRPGFQEHFAGKHIGDAFRVYGDVQGISRATISVRALSRGVRDSARRVALLYLDDTGATPGPVEDLESLPWFDMLQRGVIESTLLNDDTGTAEIFLAYAESDEFGQFLVGEERFERARTRMERRESPGHLMIYGVEGPRLRLFVREGWSVVQDGDTFPVAPREIASLGLDGGGVMEERVVLTGSMIIDGDVDVSKAFTFLYDRGSELETISVEYLTQSAQLEDFDIEEPVSDQLEEESTATNDLVEEPSPDLDLAKMESLEETVVQEENTAADGTTSEAEIVTPGPVEALQTDNMLLEFSELEQETFLERILAETSWSRVWKLLAVLFTALIAFLVKKSWVRLLSLSLTLVYLGFLEGGFLSVSHITSGIWVGLRFYLSDLPLLILVVFTVITTIFWGRVFCGFLCPFGVIQDLLEKIFPKRFRINISTKIHKNGLKLKYVFLAIILGSAASGSRVSIYQYFEPFGTVFFRSTSMTLWIIALFFLGMSLVVPRFYCRYACPLGATLALTSFFSLKRIKRVEQCNSCHVCEQNCPTGAIEGPQIDFNECVRCNVCEIKLIEKAGVCRHDIEDVRDRLVPMTSEM